MQGLACRVSEKKDCPKNEKVWLQADAARSPLPGEKFPARPANPKKRRHMNGLFAGRAALSGASPPAAEVCVDEAISAPWSAPLLRDVLTFKSPGEDLEVAALGVTVAFLVLLNEHTVPGWLPAALDEQRTPLCGLKPPTPSFCFTKDHGVLVPIGVVRPMPLTPPTSPARHRHPNLQPHPPHPTQLQTFDPQMHQYVLLLVERLRMTVGELVMAYACVERVLVLHPTTMRVNSIRPMLLGTCIIACKTSRDGDLSLWQVSPLIRK